MACNLKALAGGCVPYEGLTMNPAVVVEPKKLEMEEKAGARFGDCHCTAPLDQDEPGNELPRLACVPGNKINVLDLSIWADPVYAGRKGRWVNVFCPVYQFSLE